MRRKCSGRWLRSQSRFTSAGWSSSRLAVTSKMRSAPTCSAEPGHLRGGAPVHQVVGARQRFAVRVDEDDGGQRGRDGHAADVGGCHARLGQDLAGQAAEGLPVARRVVLRPARVVRVDGVLLEGVPELLAVVARRARPLPRRCRSRPQAGSSCRALHAEASRPTMGPRTVLCRVLSLTENWEQSQACTPSHHRHRISRRRRLTVSGRSISSHTTIWLDVQHQADVVGKVVNGGLFVATDPPDPPEPKLAIR